MARDTKKSSAAADGDQLSVPAAVSEVAKAIAQVRSVQPDAPADHDGSAATAAAAPARSRAELRADIDAARRELDDVLGELGGRLDVAHRVRTAAAEIAADPMQGVKKHPKTVIATTVVAAGVTAGVIASILALIRAIRR